MKRSFLILLLLFSSLLITGCVKNEEDKTEDGAAMEESIQQEVKQGTVYVETMAAVPMEFMNKLSLPGILRPKEEVMISAKVNGSVQGVFGEVGQAVAEGQLLCRLDDTLFRLEYEKAAAALHMERVQSEKARNTYERYKVLYKEEAVSLVELEEAESRYHLAKSALALAEHDYCLAKENLDYADIRSPISGIISLQEVACGENVGPGKTLFTIVNINHLYVEIGLLEKDIGLVRVGQEAIVRMDALPERNVVGRIRNIGPIPQGSAQVYPVRIFIDNKEKMWKPGMFATVEIITEARRALGLPKEVVIKESGKYHVFVEQEGKAVKRRIFVGLVNNGFQEIIDGLHGDEAVIITGHDKLSDGSLVRVK